jgi:hypothetical protein
MASKLNLVGEHITCFGKSLHAGQSGVVVNDWDTIVMVVADDQSYSGAHKNAGYDSKVFQVDTRYITSYKDPK